MIRRDRIVRDPMSRRVIDQLQPRLDAPEIADEPLPKIGFPPGDR